MIVRAKSSPTFDVTRGGLLTETPLGRRWARPRSLIDPLRAVAGRRAPPYPASEADRREIDVLGLRLPWRATVAITVVTLVLLLDYSRTLLPDAIDSLGLSPFAPRFIAIERVRAVRAAAARGRRLRLS